MQRKFFDKIYCRSSGKNRDTRDISQHNRGNIQTVPSHYHPKWITKVILTYHRINMYAQLM